MTSCIDGPRARRGGTTRRSRRQVIAASKYRGIETVDAIAHFSPCGGFAVSSVCRSLRSICRSSSSRSQVNTTVGAAATCSSAAHACRVARSTRRPSARLCFGGELLDIVSAMAERDTERRNQQAWRSSCASAGRPPSTVRRASTQQLGVMAGDDQVMMRTRQYRRRTPRLQQVMEIGCRARRRLTAGSDDRSDRRIGIVARISSVRQASAPVSGSVAAVAAISPRRL